MKLIILIFLTLPTLAIAEKNISAKDMSMLGKIDESTLTKEATVKPLEGPESAARSKFSVSCKDANGIEYKAGEVGYDSCLNNLKNRSDLSKINSGLNKKNSKDSSGSNINFKIGE